MRTCFICRDYIYWGFVDGNLHEAYIPLTDAYIIYDTGKWEDQEWRTVEYLGKWNVQKSAVESWGQPAKVLPGQGVYAALPAKTDAPSQSAGGFAGRVPGDGADKWAVGFNESTTST